MSRTNWDRVSRQGRIAAARDHEDRMAEEAAADATLGPAPRGLQPREAVDLAKPLEGSWWRVPTVRWRDFRRVLQYLIRHRRPLLIVGNEERQQVVVTVDGDGFSIRLAGAADEEAPRLGKTTATRFTDDAGRVWWEAYGNNHRSAAGATSAALQVSGIASPRDLTLTVLEAGLVYDDLKTAFAAPSLAVSRKLFGR